MSPTASMRFRQWTALAALAWAVLAVGVGLRAKVELSIRPSLPIAFSTAAGVTVVHDATETARALGVEPRDRVMEIDGMAAVGWLWEGGLLRVDADQPVSVQLEKPDGRALAVILEPIPASERNFVLDRWVGWGVPLVGFAYLGIGFVVWRLRPERRESWTLLLFTSITSALLFLAGTGHTARRAARGTHRPLRRCDGVPPLHDVSDGTGLDHSAAGLADRRLRHGRCTRPSPRWRGRGSEPSPLGWTPFRRPSRR